jgi:hypothetical protein
MLFCACFELRDTLVENAVFKVKTSIIQNHQFFSCYYKAEIEDQLDPQKNAER